MGPRNGRRQLGGKRSVKRWVACWAFAGCMAVVGAPWLNAQDANATTPNPPENASPRTTDADPDKLAFFEKKIRPLLVQHCYLCHSEHHKEAGGLRVDDFRSLIRVGERGQAVVPGRASESLLIARVTHADSTKTMPPDERLSESQIDDLKRWIDEGAVWPPVTIPSDIDQTLEVGLLPNAELKESHWAWQPWLDSVPPATESLGDLASWVRGEVDQFIAAGLQSQGLRPASDASRIVLLRRLSFDLTGLPPTEEELLEFLLDESSDAVERTVDRLLRSPAFGERWGRHWLDVARYGESTGSARNLPYPHAWRYRDYVIDAFAKDKPFDRFLHEQLAGDLLPASNLAQKREQLIATGFLALGVKDVNQRFKVRYDMDNVDEQIDTVSKAFLGLTVSCARCHDHKFEPISTRDYYALAGIFLSTELCDALKNQMGGAGLAYYVPDRLISLDAQPIQQSPEELQRQIDAAKKAFESARTEFQQIRDNVRQEERGEDHAKKLREARQRMQKKQAEWVALTDPAQRGEVALGVRDSKTIGDAEIRLRGEAEKIGPVVPRGVLTLLDRVPAPHFDATESGRRELAKWLTDRSNPLTARVYVNRVWQHLFGRGLVATVDNFGSTGDRPTHPELLDYLAKRFVDQGWSTKKLVRELVLSRAYQQSSAEHSGARERDPENRWVWRHTPRRLDAEELRDAILLVSGKLDRQASRATVSHRLPVIEIRNNGPEAKELLTAAATSHARSIYLPLVRGIVPPALEVFDFAEQGMVTGKRSLTTVAPQALFLLNDGFVRQHAAQLAAKVPRGDGTTTEESLVRAYRLVFQRQPTVQESDRLLGFLAEYQKGWAAQRATIGEAGVVAAADGPSNAAVATSNPSAATAAPPAAAPEDTRDQELNLDSLGETEEPASAEEAAWRALVQALLSSAEFRYVR